MHRRAPTHSALRATFSHALRAGEGEDGWRRYIILEPMGFAGMIDGSEEEVKKSGKKIIAFAFAL
jgi:hypothetical protein